MLEGKLVKIPLPTPPPSLSRLSRAFRILPFLDNYPTVQPVLNLWARLSRKAPTEWMPGHGEIIFYTQQKRPPARPPPPPTPPPQSSPLAPRCRAIVIAETLPSTYTELAILLSSFLPSFFFIPFSLSLFLASFVSNNYTPRLDNLVHGLIFAFRVTILKTRISLSNVY